MRKEIRRHQKEYFQSIKLSNRELLFVWIGYPLFVLVFFIALRLFNCGYHFVDDCEVIFSNLMFYKEGVGLKEFLHEMLKLDLTWRFRPVHILFRFGYALMFGSISLLPFAISKYIELVLCMILLHLSARKLGYKLVPTSLFVFISLLGYQSATWWRLGTHEIQGLFLFALGFYLLLNWLYEKRKLCLIISLIFFGLMSGDKESFLILLLFVMAFVIYFDLVLVKDEDNQCTKSINANDVGKLFSVLVNSVKRNLIVLLPLVSFFIVSAFILIFKVGTNNYGDFGVRSVNTISSDLLAWSESCAGDLKWYMRFGYIFLLLLMTNWESMKKCWRELILVSTFIIPQVFIYHSSGFFERYLLPVSLGYAYISVLLPSKYNILTGIRKKIYAGLLILLLMAHLRVAVIEADYFRWRGNSIQTALDTIKTLSEDNNDIKILSCMYPNQEGDMTIYYWQRYYGYDNVYTYLSDEDIIVACNLDIHKNADFYGRNSRRDFEEMDVIVMYNQDDRHWSEYKNLDVSEFDLYRCGSLDLYIRPDVDVSGIDFVEGSGETPIMGGTKAYDYDMQVPQLRF